METLTLLPPFGCMELQWWVFRLKLLLKLWEVKMWVAFLCHTGVVFDRQSCPGLHGTSKAPSKHWSNTGQDVLAAGTSAVPANFQPPLLAQPPSRDLALRPLHHDHRDAVGEEAANGAGQEAAVQGRCPALPKSQAQAFRSGNVPAERGIVWNSMTKTDRTKF